MSTLAARLIAAAEYVAALPEGIVDPSVDAPSYKEAIRLAWHLNTSVAPDEQRAHAAAIRRAIGGEWKKNGESTNLWLTRTAEHSGFEVDLVIFCDRDQVCRRVVTGTETVTLPAVEARPERTVEREVVEWQCDPIIPEAMAS